jgi:L-asparaginase
MTAEHTGNPDRNQERDVFYVQGRPSSGVARGYVPPNDFAFSAARASDGFRPPRSVRTGLHAGLVGCAPVDPIVVEVRRGEVVEARHRIHAVAVSGAQVVDSRGDPFLRTYVRSSAKPLQALPVVRARPDLDDAEIAIACASHLHRPDQLEPVQRLLTKAGATEDDLECGPEPTRLQHNCSGKHAAMLLLCRVNDWPTEGYRLPSHPLQQAMLTEIAAAAELEPQSLPTAVDGCGVVTYALTLERMAHTFSRLESLDGGLRAADAMRAHPELIRGDGAADTELMRLGDGWVAKGGAEGLLCAARQGLGIALKVEDGAQRPIRSALAALVEQLGFGVGDLANVPVENSRGEVVGELRVHRNATTG